MEDEKIIQMFFARSDQALDAVSSRYGRLYRHVLREILGDESDTEECANDVLLALWNSIPPNQPACLPAYICKIARHIGTDRLRYNTRVKRNADTVGLAQLEDCLQAPVPDQEDRELMRRVLSDFVCGLEPETQVLFVRRYVYMESVAELAQRFSLNENHISVKLYRARKKLKKILEKEGIFR